MINNKYRDIKLHTTPLTDKQIGNILQLPKPAVPTGWWSKRKCHKWLTLKTRAFLQDNDLVSITRHTETSLWDNKTQRTVNRVKCKLKVSYRFVEVDNGIELIIRIKKSAKQSLNEELLGYQKTLEEILMSKVQTPIDKNQYMVYSADFKNERTIRINISGNGEELPFVSSFDSQFEE